MNTYIIRIKFPNGGMQDMSFMAESYYYAKQQAEAFGTVMGLIESR